MKILFKYIKSNKLFPLAIFLSLIFWVLILAHPYVFRWFAALLAKGPSGVIEYPYDDIFPLHAINLCILAIGAFFIRFLAWVIMDISGELGSGSLLKKMVQKIYHRSNKEIEELGKADLKRILSKDFHTIRTGFLAAIGDTMGSLLELCIAFGAIYIIDNKAAFAFLPVMFIVIFFSRRILLKVQSASTTEANSLTHVLSEVQNSINLKLESQIYKTRKWAKKKLKTSIIAWGQNIRKLIRYQINMYLLQALTARPVLIAVIIFSFIRLENNTISQVIVGTIISGIFYASKCTCPGGIHLQSINYQPGILS